MYSKDLSKQNVKKKKSKAAHKVRQPTHNRHARACIPKKAANGTKMHAYFHKYTRACAQHLYTHRHTPTHT